MTTTALGHIDITLKALDPEPGEDGPGSCEAILSTNSLDRDGQIVDAHAFDPLPSRMTIDIDHGLSVRSVVGSGVPSYLPDGRLRVKFDFSSIPRAQEVRTLVKEGHLTSMSAAFMNPRIEIDPDDERPHIRQAELVNGSIVAIPSNRDALILDAKAASVTQDPPAPDPDTSVDPDGSSDVRQLGPELEGRKTAALAVAAALDTVTQLNERGQ